MGDVITAHIRMTLGPARVDSYSVAPRGSPSIRWTRVDVFAQYPFYTDQIGNATCSLYCATNVTSGGPGIIMSYEPLCRYGRTRNVTCYMYQRSHVWTGSEHEH
uniref:Uncharacterized protein n=1 Tax=Cacopsylla melanoneura TaxID=428564 RepID=A0A8D8Z4X2_9HEMI